MSDPTMADRPAHQREFVQALFDFEAFPGRYAVALREPRVLFDRSPEVLTLACGRDVDGLISGGDIKEELQRAARFFVRTGMLRQGADAYTLLGVPHGFDAASLRDNYRMLIRLTHPDFMAGESVAWPSDAATRINFAHDTLSSPEKKRNYDASLKAVFGPVAGSATRSAPIPVARRRSVRRDGEGGALTGRLHGVAEFARRVRHQPSVVAMTFSAVVAAIGASALTYWILQDEQRGPQVAAVGQRPLRLALDPNVKEIPRLFDLPAVDGQSPATPPDRAIVASGRGPLSTPASLGSDQRRGASEPPAVRRVSADDQRATAQSASPLLQTPPASPAPNAVLVAADPAATQLVAVAQGPAAPQAVQAAMVVPPSSVVPPSAAPAPSQSAAPPAASLTSEVAYAAPTPGPAGRITMADVQPALTALVAALQTGRGDDAFRWADTSVRRGDGPEFMQAYHRARGGARVIGIGQVSFRGTPTAGQLVVDGNIQVYMQDEGQRNSSRDIHIRAHFSSRDGGPVLMRLSLATPQS